MIKNDIMLALEDAYLYATIYREGFDYFVVQVEADYIDEDEFIDIVEFEGGNIIDYKYYPDSQYGDMLEATIRV
tara:strand:+ start:1938 stop:2159 length:222 start_codon:yes stop_codon:yes gene_type:complete